MRLNGAVLPLVLAAPFLLVGCSEDAVGPTPQATSPAVDRQAEIDAGYDAVGRQLQCMQDQGFPVSVDPEGRTWVDPGTDETRFHEAMAACHDEAVFPTPVPASDEELRGIYALELKRMDCLRSHGYEPEPAPSLEVFIDGYRQAASAGVPPWDPFDPTRVDPALDWEGIQELHEACPDPGLEDLPAD